MRKIPTLFMRDPENMRYVTREQNADCAWVFMGEGTATRKWDGTCVMYDGQRWWARREVKADRPQPAGFVALGTDRATGKTVGWEPAEQSSFAKYLTEARAADITEPGTYELVGPKINGNPEGRDGHWLLPHGTVEEPDAPRDYDALAKWLAGYPGEGLVWHHPDGRMAKIKRRDFPRSGVSDGTD